MRRWSIAMGIAAWCGLVVFGVHEIYAYATTPGTRSATPATWPTASALVREPDHATVVMFVHPECTCSRASLGELAEIARRVPSAHVVVAVAADAPGGLSWDLAGAIPYATRVLDPGAREADRFGAHTSGQVVVYDRRGALQFAGGITGSRGHGGDNVGRQSVLDVLADGATTRPEHDVFGCAMLGEKR